VAVIGRQFFHEFFAFLLRQLLLGVIGLGCGDLKHDLDVLHAADQGIIRLENALEQVRLVDDGFGFVLVVPEIRGGGAGLEFFVLQTLGIDVKDNL